jgi:hypothetical protein
MTEDHTGSSSAPRLPGDRRRSAERLSPASLCSGERENFVGMAEPVSREAGAPGAAPPASKAGLEA